MRSIKVVLIGAGSNSFGAGTINGLLASRPLREHTSLTVSLVDTSEPALDKMLRYGQAVSAFRGSSAVLEATTDRAQALPGADIVITSVSVRRNELWRQDFLIPLAYGFVHPTGECGGPGAAFHTLRSLKLVVPIARDMERLCPGAHLLNFTNPESRVCLACSLLTSVPTVGLCHGFHSTYHLVARVLDREPDGLELDLGGLNHFHWVLGIRDRATGEDVMTEFERRMGEGATPVPPLTRFLYDTFGRLPFPSDDHIGEYVQYGYQWLGPHHLQYAAAVEAGGEGVNVDWVRAVADGAVEVTEEIAGPSGEIAVPITEDLALDTGTRRPSVNVPNRGLAVANLPEDAVVEVPATVDARGVHPVPVAELPEPIAALCSLQVSIQKLLVEAYRTGSKDALLQALLLEPVVTDTRRAREMMDEMLRTQREWLPELI
jgi:alpha-galactosidase